MTFKILDCTLRDGGYINNWKFSKIDAQKIFKSISDAKVDFIEVGFIGPKKANCGLWQHLSGNDITDTFGSYSGTKIGVMINYNQPTLEIPNSVDIIRVAVHRDKVLDAIMFTEKISEMGYKTSIQLM